MTNRDAPARTTAKPAVAGKGKSCPTCGRPAAMAHRPFCSRRCADLDLGRWLKGDYRIPAVEPPDGFDDGEGMSSLPGDRGEDRND